MNANQFEPYIRSEYKEARIRENAKYESLLGWYRLANAIGICRGNQCYEAFRDATCAVAALVHKIRLVFPHGYFSVENEVLGTEEERTKLYREITEYLSMVEAGIDSFVEAHPTKAITEGGADDEEQ